VNYFFSELLVYLYVDGLGGLYLVGGCVAVMRGDGLCNSAVRYIRHTDVYRPRALIPH
jgi:hypothetical protein